MFVAESQVYSLESLSLHALAYLGSEREFSCQGRKALSISLKLCELTLVKREVAGLAQTSLLHGKTVATERGGRRASMVVGERQQQQQVESPQREKQASGQVDGQVCVESGGS